MCHRVKEGALFISDAHESDIRDGLYRFLKKIKSKQIETPQLFFMGDMFDLLVGENEYLREKNAKCIELIEEISKEIEVFYFEGNHDFSLESIFKNCEIIPIELQPMVFDISDKKIMLSHGDRYGGFVHTIFTKIIRNKTLLKILNLFDKFCDSCISKKIESGLREKNICSKIENFEEIIRAKLDTKIPQNIDMVAEGHYHQNRNLDYTNLKYTNFSSFACNQSYFIVQLSPEIEFREIKHN
jgi:UDP-2,3-diacylglucosamine hydrolase